MTDKWDRRTLLKSAGCAGLLGFGGGAFVRSLADKQGGTRAVFRDTNSVFSQFAGQQLDLKLATAMSYDGTIDCTPTQPVNDFPSKFRTGQVIELPFDDIRPDTTGRAVVAYAVCDTPADVRLRARAEGDSELADTLESILWQDTDIDVTTGPEEPPMYEGSLGTFLDQPQSMLLEKCVGCQRGGIGFEWTLPETAADTLSGASLSLILEFYARQCSKQADS